jgi:hypothetical protein
MRLSSDNQAMLKSWVKTAAAASAALYMSGVTDPKMLLNAAGAALLPVVYSWLDPKDSRYGRQLKLTTKKKAAPKKAVAKKL